MSSTTTPYRLPRIPHLRLRVTLLARRSAELPPHQGSLLCGAFGHALRRSVCAMGQGQECGTCSLKAGCVYTQIFEPLVDGEPVPFVGGLPASPRPFVFEPRGSTRSFRPGDPLELDLVLFGDAVQHQAFVVMALERMARAGLGSRRVPFVLQRVAAQSADGGWQVGFERGVRRWCGTVPAVEPRWQPLDGRRARLRLLTPARMKVDGRLAHRFSFRTMAFKMLRRTAELAHFYVPGQRPSWDFEELLERAEAVRIDRAQLRWQDWQRYSNRQGRKMKLGGVVGEIELSGELAPFAPLLRTAEVIHVGKGTTFGLGRLQVA